MQQILTQHVLGGEGFAEPGIQELLQSLLEGVDLETEILVVGIELGLAVVQHIIFLLLSVGNDVLISERK